MEIPMATTRRQGAAQLETQPQNEEIVQIENPPFQQKIYVAVGKDLCESLNALKWTLKNLDCGQAALVILHIQSPLRRIPTAIEKIPVHQVREEIVKKYMQDIEKELNGCLKKYLDICTKAKVKAETLVVEKNGVSTGIVEVVSQLGITTLIMGTSSASGSISRKMKKMKMVAPGKAEYVRRHVAEFCDVWIVCKDKLVSHNAQKLKSSISSFPEDFGRLPAWPPNIRLDLDICNRSSSSFPVTGYSTPATGEELNDSRIIVATSEVSSESEASGSPETNVDEGFSHSTVQLEHLGSQDVEALKNQLSDTLEVNQKAKTEARRETGNRKKAEAASVNANHRLKVLEAASKETMELKEKEIIHFQDSVHSRPRIETTTSVPSFSSNNLEFSEYSFDDIKAATCNFSEHFKLGEGNYTTVYKGEIKKTTVAVHIFKHSLQSQREFHREFDIVRDIRHPHLVRAVGACFERGCVIYEYMANGCLADHLSCKNGAPPLPWHARIRIAAEVCSALQYLHSLKPHPVIHGDLKPENILLDENYVSKISDCGLACPLPHDLLSLLEPKGRFSDMDPEYLTGTEYCTKSDVYRLGIVILWLLTGKGGLGLREDVGCALQSGKLGLVLDPSAGDWPFVQATQLANLALQCTNPVRKKRPDLQPTVMKMLDQLREMAVPVRKVMRRMHIVEVYLLV